MTTSPVKVDRQIDGRRSVTFGTAGELLFQSGVTALLIVILGGIGIDLVSHMWREMLPSLPPIFSHGATDAESASGFWALIWGSAIRHRFALVFAAVFVMKSVIRLAEGSRHRGLRRMAAFGLWRRRRFKQEWFTIIFINAFGAYFGALCWRWSQGFSWVQFIWSAVFGVLSPALQALVNFVHGNDLVITAQSLMQWYNANLFKFAFWLFYIAAICDDVGLPSIKTLGRWLRRRLTRAWKATTSKQLEPTVTTGND